MKKINNKAFTLIELLVVIAIIAVLVTIVIIAINPLKLIQDSQDARMRADLNQIKAAFQLYYNENKNYPSGTTMPSSGGCWSSGGGCTGTIYMKQVPENVSGGNYLYQGFNGATACNSGTCTDYAVGAILFNPNTEDGNTLTKCTNTDGVSTATFEVCND